MRFTPSIGPLCLCLFALACVGPDDPSAPGPGPSGPGTDTTKTGLDTSKPGPIAFAPIEVKPFFDKPAFTLHRPVWFGGMPGMPDVFVVLEQQEGRVGLIRKGDSAWIKEDFHLLKVNGEGECGLLGIAFHPDFVHNRRYFLYYNPAAGEAATVVEEREAAPDFLKDSGRSGKLILRVAQDNLIHQGGALAFGPRDGMLYIGLGDGGDVKPAQDRMDLRGKMLRIDVDGEAPYAIPSDNPFVGRPDTRPEIWALGLRNPWRWSFDPLTGDLWAGDVGEVSREEITWVTRGANLGWPFREGKGCRGGEPSCPGPTEETWLEPVADYPRNGGAVVVGGHVYRGNPASPRYGTYFFADFLRREILALRLEGSGARLEKVASAPAQISALGTDAAGHLYLTGHSTGIIYKLASPDLEPSTR